MAESTKEKNGDKYKGRYTGRYKTYRVDSTGAPCPRNTYLRDTSSGRTYYAKITISGQQHSCNTGILEKMPGSRSAVKEWVAAWRKELESARPTIQHKISAALADKLSEVDADVPEYPERFTVGFVTNLELKHIEEEYANSPTVKTTSLRLIRINKFFLPETDVRTITSEHIDAYRRFRRQSFTYRGTPISYGTILRELEILQRGIKIANKRGYLTDDLYLTAYELPIDRAEWRRLKKRDTVNRQQESKYFSHADCMRWLQASRGTRMEHHVYLAYRTGMRHGELNAMLWDWVYLTPGKGDGYHAEIRIPEWLYNDDPKLDPQPIAIDAPTYAYIAELARGKKSNVPILRRLRGQSKLCRRVSKKKLNGELYVTLRDLRACYGWRIQELYKDVYRTMRAMRHKKIDTTIGHYLKADDSQRFLTATALTALFEQGTK